MSWAGNSIVDMDIALALPPDASSTLAPLSPLLSCFYFTLFTNIINDYKQY